MFLIFRGADAKAYPRDLFSSVQGCALGGAQHYFAWEHNIVVLRVMATPGSPARPELA